MANQPYEPYISSGRAPAEQWARQAVEPAPTPAPGPTGLYHGSSLKYTKEAPGSSYVPADMGSPRTGSPLYGSVIPGPTGSEQYISSGQPSGPSLTGGMTPGQMEQALGGGGTSDLDWEQHGLDVAKYGLDVLKFEAGEAEEAYERKVAEAKRAEAAGQFALSMGLEREALAAKERWNQKEMELSYAQMAQQAELARLQREQQQRQMAASIGQTIAQQAAQTWAQGLASELPRGTTFAPGGEPGGPASVMARMGGAQYYPQRISPSEPPSPEEMSDWVEAAISRFGPNGAPYAGPPSAPPSPMPVSGGVPQQTQVTRQPVAQQTQATRQPVAQQPYEQHLGLRQPVGQQPYERYLHLR